LQSRAGNPARGSFGTKIKMGYIKGASQKPVFLSKPLFYFIGKCVL
jgi:hypothetical protein